MDVNRYLDLEYRDADYRRYELHQHHPRWGALLRSLLTRWTAGRKAARVPGPGWQTWRKDEVQSWTVTETAPLLYCSEGVLWLTKTGVARDCMVTAGQATRLTRGTWVIQALKPSQFEVRHLLSKEAVHAQANLLPALRGV